jgi:uncharacterized protein (TIGR02246 family)
MMKPVLLLGVPVLLTGCQVGEKGAKDASTVNSTASVDTSAEEQAIRSQIARWNDLVKAGDAAAIAGLYTEDGALMPPNTPIASERGAIQQTWASLMRTPGFGLTIVPDKIVVASSGDLALDRGTYRLTVGAKGATKADNGKYVVVWRKVAGEWKAAADIFNSDLPASGA